VGNSFASVWTSNCLVKFENFKIGADESLLLNPQMPFVVHFLHSKDNSFLKRSKSMTKYDLCVMVNLFIRWKGIGELKVY
jgi:hypothetical protein